LSRFDPVGYQMTKTRIFIACADESLRIALLLLLDHEPGMVVVGITDRLPGLITQLEVSQPDAFLLEWALPFQSVAELLTNIHHLKRPPQIIFLSNKLEDKEKTIAAGADYFITRDAPPDELILILNNMYFLQQQ
jgi:DNA-binding NarL/FixJ family response regulator